MSTVSIKRKLLARSPRVKGVDMHPTEPWVASSIFTGQVHIWNYQTQVLFKTIEVSEKPVRTVRFIPSQQWIVTGDDLAYVRVYNYNTLERVASFAAHSDYIRSIAVHPTQPYILTASDDNTIKRWDWSQGWKCVSVYAEHDNFVRYVEFNPKDANTFVSASIDGTVKVWGLNSERAHYTLHGHAKGVTCAVYYPHADKPYIASCSEDGEIKIWDYQTKKCLTTIAPHAGRSVNWLAYHPRLPYLVAGDDNGLVRLWHSSTYQPETQYNASLDRLWVLAFQPNSNILAAGYDEGVVVFKIGSERPVASMDASGRVVWAKDTEIFSARIPTRAAAASTLLSGLTPEETKTDTPTNSITPSPTASGTSSASAATGPQDGEVIPLAAKDATTAEFAPNFLKHSPNGRLVATCDGTQFVLYTGLTLKTQMHGPAADFVWSDPASGSFATREEGNKVKIYKNLKESSSFKLPYKVQRIFGGHLLAVTSSEGVDFYDWNDHVFISRISDISPLNIQWSESGDLVALVCEESTYVLRYNKDLVNKFLANPQLIPEDGIEGAVELEHELAEVVRSGVYVGSCFLYTNTSNRLAYLVGTESIPVAHTQEPVYVLGYAPRESRVYGMTKDNKLVSYSLLHDTLLFQTAILRGDGEAARDALQRLPVAQHTALARFLESQGRIDLALEISTDKAHRFELAIRQGLLSTAADIAAQMDAEEESSGMQDSTQQPTPEDTPVVETADHKTSVTSAASKLRWKLVGDLALTESFELPLARRAYTNAGDVNSLLLLYSSLGHRKGLEQIVPMAKAAGLQNVAFTAMLLLDDVKGCIDLLCEAGRAPEAACFARVYAPSLVSEPLRLWKEQLLQVDAKGGSSKLTAEALADPSKNPELFPEFKATLLAENYWNAHNVPHKQPAGAYAAFVQKLFDRNLVSEIDQGLLSVVSEDLAMTQTPQVDDAAAAKAQQEAEQLRAQQEAEQLRAQQEAALQAQREAELRAEQETALKAQQEAALRAQQEAEERRLQQEAALKAQQEAEQLRLQQEAALKAQQEAALKAQQEAEQLRLQQEAALKAQQEAALKAQQEAALKAQQEAALKAQQEAALKAQQEAALKAQQEAALKAQQEAALKAQQEAALKATQIPTIPVVPGVSPTSSLTSQSSSFAPKLPQTLGSLPGLPGLPGLPSATLPTLTPRPAIPAAPVTATGLPTPVLPSLPGLPGSQATSPATSLTSPSRLPSQTVPGVVPGAATTTVPGAVPTATTPSSTFSPQNLADIRKRMASFENWDD